MAKILNQSFDFTFFVSPVRRAWLGRKAVVTGEVEDARMEPDVVADALEHDALEIVVQDLARRTAERLEREHVATHERLERGVEHEPRVHRTRPREHEHETPQRPLGGPDLELAEVAPVDLGLLAGQGLEPEERLGAPRSNPGDVAP